MPNLVSPRTAVSYKSGHRELLSDGRVWRRYLNPAQWFNGLTGLQETVVMLSLVMVVLILVCGVGVVIRHHVTGWVPCDKYQEDTSLYSETGFTEKRMCCGVCKFLSFCSWRREESSSFDSVTESSESTREYRDVKCKRTIYTHHEDTDCCGSRCELGEGVIRRDPI